MFTTKDMLTAFAAGVAMGAVGQALDPQDMKHLTTLQLQLMNSFIEAIGREGARAEYHARDLKELRSALKAPLEEAWQKRTGRRSSRASRS